jgi:hypothetical protein
MLVLAIHTELHKHTKPPANRHSTALRGSRTYLCVAFERVVEADQGNKEEENP